MELFSIRIQRTFQLVSTAIYQYGYTIIHSCDEGDSSHPVTDHDTTRKKTTAAEQKRMAGTITG